MQSHDFSRISIEKGAPDQLIPLVVILGPTGVGKSALAIQLAERFDGEIVSADSRLFYRGMDIGTAKPTIEDRQRIPHHLIDVADPDEIWSLGIFQREAHLAIRNIYLNRHLPFLVGGTGQFIQSITEGWSIPAVEPNSHMREVLVRWAQSIGQEELHAKLAVLDPQAASVIDPKNQRRTIRALEVILSTGRRFSDQKNRGLILYIPLKIGLICSRDVLYKRIDERINNMLETGFIEEIKQLLERGYSPDLPTMSAIGYREIGAYVKGEISLEDAINLIKKRTRIFVRRQANWFKESDPSIHWLQADESAFYNGEKLISEWLSSLNAFQYG